MYKKVIIKELLILIIILIISIISSNLIFKNYVNILVKNNAYIVNEVINKNIKEEDIIKIINNINIDNIDTKIVDKYGYDSIEELESIKNLKNKIFKNNLIITLIIFILGSTSYNIYIIKQEKRLKQLDKYLNSILNNNYSLDIKDYNEGMISNLKNDIYKVTVKLKEQNDNLIKDKKELEELLSNISHQIKTPLTSMFVINDILKEDNLDSKKRKEFINKNKNQLDRIEWLVSSLLKLSRLESGMINFEKSNIKIKKLLDKVIEPISINLELKEIDLEISGELDTIINVDVNWFTEALLNILKNGMEYTKDKIKIEISNNPLYVEFKIIDNGKGINSNDLPHIFERFYKGNNNNNSFGIGLNMSKKIINMHNGDIKVSSLNGTTFIIKLYKNII